MKNTIQNYKAKLFIVSLSAGIAGCNAGITNPEAQNKSVSISPTSIIPTNLGISGGHALKVDNHTGTNLTLNNFYLSDTRENDSRISLAGCKTLAKDSSCVLRFSPDQADGSAVLKLDFVDENGERYSAAQLVEYSSQINESNGFYVSSTNLDRLTSTNSYSLAIPFVADEDYSSISIDTSIKTLSKSIDCAQGTSKGSHCTALLTLPAADPKSGEYNNSITIKGVKADGSISFASIASRVSYSDVAHLAITNGPLLIKVANLTAGDSSLSQTIKIVNNGDQTAKNISATSVIGANWLEGVTSAAGGTSLLSKQITCNGNNSAILTLPSSLDKGGFCEVKFSLTKPNATGSEDYSVSYTGGGINPAAQTFARTKIYFDGKYKQSKVNVTPDSPTEIMLGESFNFSVTRDGGSADSIVVSAVFTNGDPYGMIVSQPTPCNLNSTENKAVCRFTVVSSSPLSYDATLAKILPLPYAAANGSYKIKVSATNNAQVVDPELSFSIYTPTTNPLASVDSRFTSAGECMIDNLTGLMWPKNMNMFGTKKWDEALSAVAAMNSTPSATGYNLCGYTDWYLPTTNELGNLIQYPRLNLSKDGFYAMKFDVKEFYWSSSSVSTKNIYSWIYKFPDTVDRINYVIKTSADGYVWPVRRAATSTSYLAQVPVTGETGGAAGSENGVAWPKPRFVVGRGATANCITDKLTGLMWVKDLNTVVIKGGANNSPTSYGNGLESIKEGVYCGYKDWRLPRVNEISSLINYGFFPPVEWLNDKAQGFSNVKSDNRYWSRVFGGTGPAFLVDFSSGRVTMPTPRSFYIWPVRGGK